MLYFLSLLLILLLPLQSFALPTNRDITQAQEITKDEATNAEINIPIELILDPKQYAKDVKDAPEKHWENIKDLPENVKQKITALKAWAEKHGLTLGLSGEGEDLTVQIIVPEGMEDSGMPFGGKEFGVVQLTPEGDAVLRKQLGLPEDGTLTVIMSADGEAEIVYGEGAAGTMTLNGLRLAAVGSTVLPEIGAAVVTCAASVVCGLAVGTVIIAGVTYAAVTNNKPVRNTDVHEGTTAAAGGPGLDPDQEPGDWEPNQGRKSNPTKSESEVWKDLKHYKKDIKTNGLSGNKQRFYQWDHTHNDIEVYNKQGKHLGSMNPTTGEMYKPPVPGRTLF